MKHTLLAVCALAFVSTASAAEVREHAFVVGPAAFRPSLTVGVEGWSNPFLKRGERVTGLASDKEVPGFDFVLTPALGIRVATEKVRFDFDGSYTLRKYFGSIIAPKLDQFSNFRIQTGLNILPNGVVGIHLRESSQLDSRGLNREFFKTALLRQFRNELNGGLDFRLGRGVTLVPDFQWAYHTYKLPGDVTFGDDSAFNRRHTFAPGLALEWRFFPETVFLVDFRASLNRWRDNFVETKAGPDDPSPVGRYLALPNSDFYRSRIGLRGRMTKIFLIKLTAGYGVGKYLDATVTKAAQAVGYEGDESDPEASHYGGFVKPLDALIFEVETTFDLGLREEKRLGQEISLQYVKDFEDTYFTNYVAYHHLRLSWDGRWGRFFGTHIDGGVRFEGYHGEVSRDDRVPFLNADLTVHATDWFDVSGTVAWNQRTSTDKDISYDNVVGSLLFKFGF